MDVKNWQATAAFDLFERQARLCQVLADPKRLRLLHALRHGERTVGDLAGMIEVSYSNVSQHLAIMREAGLVSTRREGTSIFYHITYPQIVAACDMVRLVLQAQLEEAAALAKR
ncbi:MAG: metalloregulator ArsR/SmtB family transcription factor [Chloroflexi bacterium]|nr:metalloregulator ArsR/SmtB family transcription factor [Chloroflexota bacterium]